MMYKPLTYEIRSMTKLDVQFTIFNIKNSQFNRKFAISYFTIHDFTMNS